MSINYAECVKQANKLRGIAEEYERMYNAVNNLANNSPEYWQGEANEMFRENFLQWQKEARSIKNEMEHLAYLIKKTSLQIKKEEAEEV